MGRFWEDSFAKAGGHKAGRDDWGGRSSYPKRTTFGEVLLIVDSCAGGITKEDGAARWFLNFSFTSVLANWPKLPQFFKMPVLFQPAFSV